MSKIELDLSGLKLVAEGVTTNNASEQAVGTKTTPLYLDVDTGVDYAAIVTGIAGLIVAIMVARFTLGVQRNQIQANVSTLRHHWMNELRGAASELLQTMSVLANNLKQVDGYKGGEAYVESMKLAIILENKIALLMSRDDKTSAAILNKIRSIMNDINGLKKGEDNKQVFRSMVELKELLRAELESAWDDIKTDLGINRKFLGIRVISDSRGR
ncbi:hypothetical protein [Pseudomonas urmiensis]|uniref:Uncharacterized protein n=1 Tax=Pseudomonas urmiensis TaxID=2745493 RepID=A0A923JVR8_9PSED|nr:hypothetical protein [Pseudomonas urmiensis]MBV4536912.1 hypothetical protein [Pseudomonas urmiensis]